ncbi:toxin ParE1/3/4 [Terrimicrobium sacchariphilum]|uniref:Toxin ParE1/3/4 n=1 Tax=Terrimicrobium sacchariphilum TaxID=690879 RepID=A0A146G2F2_TERSA|nr:toxin ParE1/3/4 [Terrimicrobium sacchariphilum]
MARLLRTPQSQKDFEEIWDFIADDNPNAADSLLRLLDETASLLARAPGLGRKRPEILPEVRSFPVGNYVLYYFPIADGIQLLRVLHGARDINTDYFS